MNITLVVMVEWPDTDPPDGAIDWLRQMIDAGLATSDDNRGAFVDETTRFVNVIQIKGIQSAL